MEPGVPTCALRRVLRPLQVLKSGHKLREVLLRSTWPNPAHPSACLPPPSLALVVSSPARVLVGAQASWFNVTAHIQTVTDEALAAKRTKVAKPWVTVSADQKVRQGATISGVVTADGRMGAFMQLSTSQQLQELLPNEIQ